MSSRILSIGTAVPIGLLEQDETRNFFVAQPGIDRLASRLIQSAFDQSAIESRYSVIKSDGESFVAFADDQQILRSPSTGERNAVYRREAPALFASASRDALTRAGLNASDVTHVVTVSCTGFFAPGPDFQLVKELGLHHTVERTHIGFMGCAAALPALRVADRICNAEVEAIVLVVCAELCSIHIRSSPDPEQIVASAVFGDGAAAAIVSSSESPLCSPSLEIGKFTTAITSEGEKDMDWTIGDEGFEMRLSPQVPRIIGREISSVADTMLGGIESVQAVDAWAVHPGGRSVLDRVQSGLNLPEGALGHSRTVLREFGNMSSATVLFILQRILRDTSLRDGAQVASLCFGPGLTVETARFTLRVPSSTSEAVQQ